MAETTRPAPSPVMRMAIDFGPLLVFFAVNSIVRGAPLERGLAATAAFMIAMTVAMIYSWWRTRHISPMLWISAVMVILFGSLTLYFHNLDFIQLKPTIYYAALSIALTYGLVTKRPLLQSLLGSAYPGLSDKGWRLLTINWALFFVVMAIANVVVWRAFSFDFWTWFKVWAVIPATILFAFVNIPLLLRHGLQLDDDGGKVTEAALPPEG